MCESMCSSLIRRTAVIGTASTWRRDTGVASLREESLSCCCLPVLPPGGQRTMPVMPHSAAHTISEQRITTGDKSSVFPNRYGSSTLPVHPAGRSRVSSGDLGRSRHGARRGCPRVRAPRRGRGTRRAPTLGGLASRDLGRSRLISSGGKRRGEDVGEVEVGVEQDDGPAHTLGCSCEEQL